MLFYTMTDKDQTVHWWLNPGRGKTHAGGSRACKRPNCEKSHAGKTTLVSTITCPECLRLLNSDKL